MRLSSKQFQHVYFHSEYIFDTTRLLGVTREVGGRNSFQPPKLA